LISAIVGQAAFVNGAAFWQLVSELPANRMFPVVPGGIAGSAHRQHERILGLSDQRRGGQMATFFLLLAHGNGSTKGAMMALPLQREA